jgi:hypothetical protein
LEEMQLLSRWDFLPLKWYFWWFFCCLLSLVGREHVKNGICLRFGIILSGKGRLD